MASAILATVAVATWFVSLPQRDPGLWALDPFNTGLKVMRAGNLELAQTKLETALRLVPDNAEINFGLGNLWYEKGDLQRARYGYRRAIELNERHASAWMNLGRVETHDRQWEAAGKCLSTAITLDPNSARAHLFLAEMKHAQGDLPAARSAITRSLELKPNQPELIELQRKIESARAP